MKLNVLGLALAASAFIAVGANAQTVVIEKREPAVVIEHEEPASRSVTVEQSGPLGLEKKKTTVETTGSGLGPDCTTRTTTKENLVGSKTVSKTKCD